MTGDDAGRLPPLPVRPRPRRSESADSYLRRLAAANHLRFTYLRRYLASPQGSYGPVDPGRLAALAGRELPAILRALPGLAPAARPPARRYTPEDIKRNHDARREKYAAIRRDHASGMSERAIERKHHVGRRTIIKALASAEPPARKKIHRGPAALDGLHDHIDAMLKANPQITTAAIWQQLADEHDVTVAYPTLRTYVTGCRAGKPPRQVLQHFRAPDLRLIQEPRTQEMRHDMANAKSKHRKKQDLPVRAQAYLSLLYESLLSADELFKLIEAIRRAIH
jgi:transposase